MRRITPNALRTLHTLRKTIRRDILTHSYLGHGAHISSSLSIADILTVLYGAVLRHTGKNAAQRDRFILSKGHAAPALYAALAAVGILPRKALATYGHDGSSLAAHPEYDLPGVELATGSLGHGLSVGCGMAYAGLSENSDCRVYVLISDAELNEGAVWEAFAFGAHHALHNLTAIVDVNGLQAFGRTSDVLNYSPLRGKIESFGWTPVVVDGHSHSQLLQSLSHIPRKKGRPTAVIAKTTAGKGISFMENKLEWHYRNLDEKLYKLALGENEKDKNV